MARNGENEESVWGNGLKKSSAKSPKLLDKEKRKNDGQANGGG